MIDVEQALAILEQESEALAAVEVDLCGARGAVLAERVVADRDVPPADCSAMDGFAVRAADLPEPDRSLRIVGEVRAGQSPEGTAIEAGQAARIYTGAMLPAGADTVVMIERAREDGAAGTVSFDVAPTPGRHVRGRGQDLGRGETVLCASTPLHAPQIAALASVGHTRVRVHRRPTVYIVSTGDEIVEPERSPEPHQVRNSNAATLSAQLAEMGLEPRHLGIATDDRERLDEMLARGLAGDLLLVTGGVSVGAYDRVPQALEDAGARVLFHRVAIRPGKPMLAARAGNCRILGLPGNPVSTYAGFAVFGAPLLRRMMGYRRWKNVEVPVTLGESFRQRPGRVTYHLARIELRPEGLVARPVKSTGSGDVLSLARANGFVVAPDDARDPGVGTRLPALLWRDFARFGSGEG